jgi:hypothetical protein
MRSGSSCAGPTKRIARRQHVDIYAIIFMVLTVFIVLRLRSVLGQRTGSERPPYLTGILLTLIAAALGAVIFDVGGAKWYPVLATGPSTTAAPTISGPARVIDGDTVVGAGTTVRLKGVDAAGCCRFLTLIQCRNRPPR